MHHHLRILFAILTGTILFASTAVQSETFTVFEQTYDREQGKPRKINDRFTVLNPDTSYFVKVDNGADGQFKRVSSATIRLNGIQVVKPQDFNQTVDQIEKPIVLTNPNEIVVELKSPIGSGIAVEIVGIDNDPPMITASASPPPNANGWNNTTVTVSFECSDAISGITSCPSPVTVSAETENQVVSGTAVDNAGNTATADVELKIDKTPPAISRTWPPVDEFGTDRVMVPVEGALSDNLSGIDTADVAGPLGTLALSSPSFGVVADLRTDITAGERSVDSKFVIEATDAAGNSTQSDFIVFHTLASTVLPSDITETELVDGVLQSVDRALIRFVDDISTENLPEGERLQILLDQAHAIIESEGGRLTGFLVHSNMAQAVFPTDTVADLEVILQTLESMPEVLLAVPVSFPEVDQPVLLFDNAILPAAQAIAYANVQLLNAATTINNANLSQNAATIAILDTGFDPVNFGNNNELAGINLIDLCTRAGRDGQPSANFVDLVGHGTHVTGIVAGANNGNGNNGMIRGIPGGQFSVDVFRVTGDCNGNVRDLDNGLISIALDWIEGGELGNVHVVNMSYGQAGENSRDLYQSFFNTDRGGNVLWVASAGNGDLDPMRDGVGDPVDCAQPAATLGYPAALSCTLNNVVSVAAHDPNTNTRTAESNFGDSVTLSAPGDFVWTANNVNFGANPALGRYFFFDGTSAAAPMVTGAAALALSVAPLSPAEILQLLANNATVALDPSLPQGGLNVNAMINALVAANFTKQRFEGLSSGGTVVFDANPAVAIPGLAGFLLDFVDDDHHIREVMIDFDTPTTGIVAYTDQDGDDDYTYSIDRQQLPAGTIVDSAGGCSSGGPDSQVVAGQGFVGVPVLVGFDFQYQSDDHHIDEIRVDFNTDGSGQLVLDVAFDDKNNDDDYCYNVVFAMVPPGNVRAQGQESGFSNGGVQTQTYSGGQQLQRPVLQGFSLNYEILDVDHHIDQTGVRLDQNSLSVFYNDKKDDDFFSWMINWVDLN